jgi:hypothetical protein
MAFTNIDNLNLGTMLQIVFSNGVRNQISQDYRDWEEVKRNRVGNTAAREVRFMLQSSYGPAAIQYRRPGDPDRAFPAAQQATVQEYSAQFKEINATIELEYNLWDRARKSPEKYAEPLALEIQSKTTASKRRIAADFYTDGTGVAGETTDPSANWAGGAALVTATLDADDTARGGVGQFEFGDFYIARATDGSAPAATTLTVGGTDVSYFRVEEKDRDNDTVTFTAYDSSDNALSGALVAPATPLHLYRIGQPTIPNLASPGDYGTATEVIPGLESLTASDGRSVHGITMSGVTAGSRLDAGNVALTSSAIQKALDKVKINVGADAYRWKKMCMSPEAHAALIADREDDRRFQTVQDNKRGITYFAYVHGNDTIETYTSEYVPKKRIYMLPESKAGEKVLEYWGSDFETVKANGMSDFHLKPASGGGHVNTVSSYLSSIGTIVCKHPASIAVVTNFTA